MAEATQSKPAEANSIRGPILVLEQRANFVEARRIAAEHNGRLPTLQEFIHAINNPEQFKQLRGDWYWTGEEQVPIKPEGYCRIDYEHSVLVQVTGKEWNALPAEQKAYMLGGSGAVEVGVGNYWFGGKLYGGGAAAGPANGARVAFISLEPKAAAKGR